MTKPRGYWAAVIRRACELRKARPTLDPDHAVRLAEDEVNRRLDAATGQGSLLETQPCPTAP